MNIDYTNQEISREILLATYDAIWNATRQTTVDATWRATRDATSNATWNATGRATHDAAYNTLKEIIK